MSGAGAGNFKKWAAPATLDESTVRNCAVRAQPSRQWCEAFLWIPTDHRIIKRQNGKRYKGKPNMAQSALARRIRQGCCEISFCVISRNFHKIFNFVFAKFSSNFAKIKIILSKFCVSRNFDKIIFNFAKLEENLAKHAIKIFAKLRKQKFRSNPTPTQSAICYSPSPSVC